MPSSLHPMLNVAVRAARAAGAIINHAALDIEAVRVSEKSANNFVTEVDVASEAAIIETLLTAYPDHGILAEESGRERGNRKSDHIWIIDPLDGTTNFIHGFPTYCVSIALAVRGRVEQAVIYDPARNNLFTATRGRGAYLDNRRIRVSKRVRLNEALVATGCPFQPGTDYDEFLHLMARVSRHVSALRRPGSAALDLAYVAAGFTDGYFETGLKPWDVAAGSLLVTEAGGLIGNFTGETGDLLGDAECLAAPPRIYGHLVGMLKRYSRFYSAGPHAGERKTGSISVDSATAGKPADTKAPDGAPSGASGAAEVAPAAASRA